MSRRLPAAFLVFTFASAAGAGPIDVYRQGARFCPHDRSVDARVLTQAQAIERARGLLPGGYCGPSAFVSGCDVVPEYSLDSWRIYFHQYRLRDAEHDWGGLTHTYVVLDPRGNCYANIPGTEQGSRYE